MVAFSIILTINYFIFMPIYLLSFPNTSLLCCIFVLVFLKNFMYVYGQLSAIKDLLLLYYLKNENIYNSSYSCQLQWRLSTWSNKYMKIRTNNI